MSLKNKAILGSLAFVAGIMAATFTVEMEQTTPMLPPSSPAPTVTSTVTAPPTVTVKETVPEPCRLASDLAVRVNQAVNDYQSKLEDTRALQELVGQAIYQKDNRVLNKSVQQLMDLESNTANTYQTMFDLNNQLNLANQNCKQAVR